MCVKEERTKNKCLTFLKCKKIKGGEEEQRILIDKFLHLLSVGKSDPGLKRCGVVFGRFDTRRVEEEAVLFGIANKNVLFLVVMVQMKSKRCVNY